MTNLESKVASVEERNASLVAKMCDAENRANTAHNETVALRLANDSLRDKASQINLVAHLPALFQRIDRSTASARSSFPTALCFYFSLARLFDNCASPMSVLGTHQMNSMEALAEQSSGASEA